MGVEDSDKLKLYIRLPSKIKDAFDVKELNKNIVEVSLPRQKSSRWCIVRFEDKEKLTEAAKELKNIKIEGKSIKVSFFKRKQKAVTSDSSALETDALKSLLKEQIQS